jgi:hypothetical protein
MNTVAPSNQGQAGGIEMTSQLSATVGMAVCSVLFSMTNDFQVVFPGHRCIHTGHPHDRPDSYRETVRVATEIAAQRPRHVRNIRIAASADRCRSMLA